MLDKNTTAMQMMDDDPQLMKQVNRGGEVDVPPQQQTGDDWLEVAANALDVMSLINPAGNFARKFNPQSGGGAQGMFGWLYDAWKNEGGKKPQMEGDIYNTHQKELAVFDAKTFDYFNKLYNSFDQDTEQTQIAQRMLRDIKYYDGEIDGFYGPETKGAIKRYLQNRNDATTVWSAMEDQSDVMTAASNDPTIGAPAAQGITAENMFG